MAKVILTFEDIENEKVSVTVTCEPEMPEMPENMTKERLTNAQKIALQTIAIVEKIFEEKI